MLLTEVDGEDAVLLGENPVPLGENPRRRGTPRGGQRAPGDGSGR